MDKRKLMLLKFFLNKCDGGYKVIEVSKIFAAIRKYKNNFNALNDDIQHLKQGKYIDVKYLDENNVCLDILDNSHVLQENIRSERGVNRKHLSFLVLSMVLSGFMAFAGAFLAIIITR